MRTPCPCEAAASQERHKHTAILRPYKAIFVVRRVLKCSMFLQFPVAFIYRVLGAILQTDIPFGRTDWFDSCWGIPAEAGSHD